MAYFENLSKYVINEGRLFFKRLFSFLNSTEFVELKGARRKDKGAKDKMRRKRPWKKEKFTAI